MKFHVVIACPHTRRDVAMGLDITKSDKLPKYPSQLRCPASGRTHDWARADVLFAHSLESLNESLLMSSTRITRRLDA